jgi:hypothetical protein
MSLELEGRRSTVMVPESTLQQTHSVGSSSAGPVICTCQKAGTFIPVPRTHATFSGAGSSPSLPTQGQGL